MLQYLILLLSLCISRLIYIYFQIGQKKCFSHRKLKIMAVAGSGGHTSEMIRLVEKLPSSYSPRDYVIATSDRMSEKKILEMEKSRSSSKDPYHIYHVPRSREVAQSWLTTVYTTFVALIYSFPILWSSKPDVILCNGPGTCIPICAVSFLFKFLGICWTDIIYVESICRVTTMSMSGWLLYPFTDQFFVQWPQLQKQYPKAIYLNGRIV